MRGVKRTTSAAVLLVAALAAAVFWWRARHVATAEFTAVKRIEIGDTLQERGWLEAALREPITLGANGELREILEEGTIVKPGDLVVSVDTSGGTKDHLDRREEDVLIHQNRLETTKYRRIQTEREARKNIIITGDRLKLAEMEYGEIRTGLTPEDRRLLEITTELRTIDREDAEEAFFRQSNLVARALASPITLEDYERRLAASVAGEEEAKIEYAVRTAPPREDEILEKKLAVERLQGELERGERALERRLARMDAEIAEHVARIEESQLQYDQVLEEYESGDVFAATAGIFKPRYFWDHTQRLWQPIRAGVRRGYLDRVGDIIQPGAMRVMSMVYEADIAKVATNMPAEIRIPALKNQVFTGRLQTLGGVGRDRAEVGPSGVEGNLSGVTVFNATLTLEPNDGRLRPGMSASVTIQCLPVASRLVLPREAVGEFHIGNNTGKVRLENGETREITGRHIAGVWFWVEGGLDEGDRVRRHFK